MNKARNRSELKYFFRSKNIPTEENFSDLVSSTINYAEDGLRKLDGDPLSIEAQGGIGTQKKVLSFFNSFNDSQPGWILNLNPRVDPENAEETKPGFSLSTTDSKGLLYSRFFVSHENGSVGINTVAPQEKLHVEGRVQAQELTLGRLESESGNTVFFGHNQVETADLSRSYALAQGNYGTTELNSSTRIEFSINRHRTLELNNKGFHISEGMRIYNENMYLGSEEPLALLQVDNDILVTDGGFDRDAAIRITNDAIDCVFLESDGYEYVDFVTLYIQRAGGRTVLGGDLKIEGKVLQEEWKKPDFNGGWGDSSPTESNVGFYKDAMGIVHIRGYALERYDNAPKDFSGEVKSRLIFTLPEEYWPQQQHIFSPYTGLEMPTRIDVHKDGRVVMEGGWTSRFLSFDGIYFRAKS